MAIRTITKQEKDSQKKTVMIETTTLPGSIGVKLQARIGLNLISLAAPLMRSKDKESLLDHNVDLDAVSSSLTSNMGEDSVLQLLLDILQCTMIDGSDLSKVENFDMVFSGEYGLLFRVVKFVLEANFGDFLAEKDIKKFVKKMWEMQR